MAIKLAIQKAIEGGYKHELIEHWAVSGGYNGGEVEKFLLDPSFWQALGKALNWMEFDHETIYGEKKRLRQWLEEWHRFIDHLAENKDPNEFFKELLT